MRLSLPSREHIADNIEIMTLSHCLDGWVGVTNCDKITPGMLMAAGRLDLPAVLLTGGPMQANIVGGHKHHPIEGFRLVGEVKAGKKTSREAEDLLPLLACGAGACVGLFTANTLAVVTEVLGMSLSGCATTPATDSIKKQQAYQTGLRIVELVKTGVRPRTLLTPQAFENAIRVDMAMGGSTNAVLHIPAIAKEAGIRLGVDRFDKIARETPNLCSVIPAGPYEMADIHKAGGIPAVLHQLQEMIADSPTVSGMSISRIATEGIVRDPDVIRSPGHPFRSQGGIAVLRGNLADSAVVKQSAVDPDMMVHAGPARVFHTEEELLAAIEGNMIQEGDVVVLPFQGPAGGPGMPEMLTPTDALRGAGYQHVALVTDGRFSGATSGPCVGHVEMEAYNGGAIGAVKDGDIVEIDIPGRSLNVRLEDHEIGDRLQAVTPPERDLSPMLASYRRKYQSINCYGREARRL
jgi:dihydroxy-acid dehydratase